MQIGGTGNIEGMGNVDGKTCMFCGSLVQNQGEAYYDHIRASKGCEHAWRQWRENLYADHPGGD